MPGMAGEYLQLYPGLATLCLVVHWKVTTKPEPLTLGGSSGGGLGGCSLEERCRVGFGFAIPP